MSRPDRGVMATMVYLINKRSEMPPFGCILCKFTSDNCD